jgi:hypothetical protein
MSSSSGSEPHSPTLVRWELAERLVGGADGPARQFLEILLSRLSILVAQASQRGLVGTDDPRAPLADIDAAFVSTAVLDVFRAYDVTLTERSDM